ncbi:prephenate dehydrogenase [Streptomyces sp. NPDC058877]|uniref:prephenate dehydrogenase n=1 Tax=Streptomyces sp. NPDC058877 TaxID=3346665 RepID=UPI0036C06C19
MRSALIVGTGAIGTSIALALRARGVVTHLRDTDASAARTAQDVGAGTTAAPNGTVDVAVLAVPPAAVATTLVALQQEGAARCYTDVAGVKALPEREIEALGCDPTSVVGGHPLVGNGRPGPLAARADLFEGYPWALVPTEATANRALNIALTLVSLCGATPVFLDAEGHDLAMARVSHAPHLISTLLASRLRDTEASALRLAGKELLDVTRGAGASPALWADLLSANAAAVADVLEAFAEDTLGAAAVLRAPGTPDAAPLLDLLRKGTQGQVALPGKYGVPPADLATVQVVMGDDLKQYARFFGDMAAGGVAVADIVIDRSAHQGTARMSLTVSAANKPVLVSRLRRLNWHVQGGQ